MAKRMVRNGRRRATDREGMAAKQSRSDILTTTSSMLRDRDREQGRLSSDREQDMLRDRAGRDTSMAMAMAGSAIGIIAQTEIAEAAGMVVDTRRSGMVQVAVAVAHTVADTLIIERE